MEFVENKIILFVVHIIAARMFSNNIVTQYTMVKFNSFIYFEILIPMFFLSYLTDQFIIIS